ncbi:hypothetical protein [Aureimonas sp. Leaf454]|uniref:hypothetical protein n=1 Tax=Aureimonas sp. Leaf454 TaxID=1736381 RepID=UPI0012E382D2|nr:hypothetical protein [Aureimonas sp. Leaf454]
MAEFEATFEDASAGTGFKYLARTAKQTSKGTYSKQLKLPSDIRQRYLFSLIESTARSAIAEILNNGIEVDDELLKSSSKISQNKSA